MFVEKCGMYRCVIGVVYVDYVSAGKIFSLLYILCFKFELSWVYLMLFSTVFCNSKPLSASSV